MAYGTMYAGEQGGLSTAREIDVRSMRKIEEMNQTMYFVYETFELPADIRLSASLLVALH